MGKVWPAMGEEGDTTPFTNTTAECSTDCCTAWVTRGIATVLARLQPIVTWKSSSGLTPTTALGRAPVAEPCRVGTSQRSGRGASGQPTEPTGRELEQMAEQELREALW
jgi:hypothetical protein